MSSHRNPFETPRPKGIRLLQATLRVLTAIQCFGMASGWWHYHRRTPLVVFLEQGVGVSAEHLSLFQNATAGFLLVCGLATLFRPSWLFLFPLVIYQMAVAISTALIGTDPSIVVEPGLYAAAASIPLALMFVDFWPPSLKASLIITVSSVGLLRAATVCTFLCGGIIALMQFRSGGRVTDIVLAAMKTLTQQEITSEQAQWGLCIMGVIQIGLAFSLLTARNRMIAFVMASWAFGVLVGWMLSSHGRDYDLILSNIGVSGAPLVVFLFWLRTVKEQKPMYLPEFSSRDRD